VFFTQNKRMKKKNISYQTAMDELKALENALENNEIPIDLLAEKLQRAEELIEFCQTYLRTLEQTLKDKTKEIY
jgi:exodeoxyribonuclease VII small subunit